VRAQDVCDPTNVCGSQVAALANSLSGVLGGGFVREAVLHPWGRPATEEVDDPTEHDGLDGATRPVPEALQAGPAEGATARFVSGAQDGSLMLWRAADGGRERTWEGHGWGHAVRALALLPPGRLVSGSTDGTLRVWRLADVGTGALVLSGHEDTVRALLALPGGDGGRVLSGSDDSTLRLWSLAPDGGCECVLRGHSGAVWTLALLADASGRVVSGSWDGTLRVWALPPPGAAGAYDGAAPPDAPHSACERVLAGHTKAVYALAALPGGSRCVSGSADQTLRVWDAGSGACERVLDLGRGGVAHALLALGEARVVCGCGDGALRVWHVDAPARCERVLKGHADGVFALALLPDGRIVSGSSDKSLCVWAAAERERVLVPPVAAGTTWALVALGPPPTRPLTEWAAPPLEPSPRKEELEGLRRASRHMSEEAALPSARAPSVVDDDGEARASSSRSPRRRAT
jgi:hypothetical protein